VRRRLERRLVAAILTVIAGSALIALHSPLGTDYGNLACHLGSKWCDEAGFPLHALIHGDLDGFFAQQPLMGPVTLLLRAPFAALARIGSEDVITM